VHVAGFFCAGLARKNANQRRFATHEQVDRGMDGVEVFEGVHALGASAEFTGRLRAAKKKNAEDGCFVAMKVVDVAETMLEFGDAGIAARRACQSLIAEGAESVADFVFAQGHDRFAIGFLIACVDEGVERERIVLRSGDFFFDQGAEDTSFDIGEAKVHLEILSGPAFVDIPDIKILFIAGGGNFVADCAGGAIEGGADFFFAGQRGRR